MPRTAILEELQRHFDYAAKLTVCRARRACSIPGTTSMVHVYHAEMLYTAAPEPKTLHIFDQGGHNDIFYWNRQASMQLVETFLAAL